MPHHINRTLFAAIGVALAASAGPLWSATSSRSATVRLGPLGERPRSGGRVVVKLNPPIVRIGLGGDGRTVSLDSAGGVYVVDRQTGRDVWKHIQNGPLRIVLERGGAPEEHPVYRVQVASLADKDEADALKERLETETGEVVVVAR